MPGRTVVQWDKEDCANMKIIKVDLLGLGMMAVLKDCQNLIYEHYTTNVNLAALPQEQKIYDQLANEDQALLGVAINNAPVAIEHKQALNMSTLPQDDYVYEILRDADTIGMFQVESRAQMASIPHNAPQRNSMISLCRSLSFAPALSSANDEPLHAPPPKALKKSPTITTHLFPC